MASKDEVPVSAADNEPDLRRELDLELLTSIYEALRHDEAFDSIFHAWQRRSAELGDDVAKVEADPILSREIDRLSAMVDDDTMRHSGDPLQRAVEETPSPALIVNAAGSVVLMNRAAQDRFGPLGSFRPADFIDHTTRAEFDALLRAARYGGNRDHAIVRLDPIGDGDLRPFAEMKLLSPNRHSGRHQAERYIALRMLQVPWSGGLGDILRQSFALTDAEVEVARLLYETRNAEAIAKARDASPKTVKTQIQAILVKTDCASRAELIDLISTTAPRLFKARSDLAEWTDPLARERVWTRPGGKKLAYTWVGAPDGQPLILWSGYGIDFLPPAAFAQGLRKADIRLIIPSRPGYGNSQPDMSKSAIDDQCAAIADLVSHLGVRGCPIVASRSGVLPLWELSCRDPGIFSRIVSHGTFWTVHAEERANRQNLEQSVVSMLTRSPMLIKLMIRFGMRNVRKYGVQWYISRAGNNLAVDSRTLANTDHMPLLRHSAQHQFMQGDDVATRELALARWDWRDALDRTRTPVHMILPEEDPVLDPASFGRSLAARPHVSCEIVTGTGALMMHQKPGQLAQAIVNALRPLPADRRE